MFCWLFLLVIVLVIIFFINKNSKKNESFENNNDKEQKIKIEKALNKMPAYNNFKKYLKKIK